MNAAACAKPESILSARGRAPSGSRDRWFFPGGSDGEWHIPEDQRLRGIDAQIGLIELNNGRWLAHPDGTCIDYPSFPSRETALRSSIAKLIRRQRMLMQAGNSVPVMMTVRPEKGRAVIAWALSLKPASRRAAAAGQHPIGERPWPEITGPIDPDAPPYWRHAEDDATQLTRDPVVNQMVEAFRLRGAFPAKHIISMTTEVTEGRVCIVGTCACGHVMKYLASDQLRLDAAQEAHWRRFDWQPQVDGRGIPIKPGDGSRIPSAKKSRKKSRPGAGGHPAPIAEAPGGTPRPEPAPVAFPAGAGSPQTEAATDDEAFWASPLIRAAVAMAWRDEVGS